MSVVRKTPKSRRDARAVRSNLGQLRVNLLRVQPHNDRVESDQDIPMDEDVQEIHEGFDVIRGRKIESGAAIKMAKNILNYVGLGEGNKQEGNLKMRT